MPFKKGSDNGITVYRGGQRRPVTILLESFFNFTETRREEIDLMFEITISLHLVLHKLY